MRSLIEDVRYAIRVFFKDPTFTGVVVICLGLSFGACATVFSLVDVVLISSLPLPEPEDVVACVSTNHQRGITRGTVPYSDYTDWKSERDIFRSIALYTDPPFDLADGAEPERVRGAAVTDGFFAVMAVRPLLGRSLASEDHEPGAEPVTVLSEELWRRRWGGEPSVVGRTVRLNGEDHAVVGVMQSSARWPTDADVWVPLQLDPAASPHLGRRDNFAWRVIGRLAPEVTIAQAHARVEAMARRIAEQHPDLRKGTGAAVIPLHDFVVLPNVRRALWVLMGSAVFVLLIACANLANLMLVRAAGRSREMAVRAALGANRLRLIRMQVTEGMLLAAASAVVGLTLGVWGVELLAKYGPQSVPRLAEGGINARVIMVTLFAALPLGALLGMVPIVRVSRSGLSESLRGGWRGSTAGPGRHRLRRSLMIAEVALSLVLLVGAGLMANTLVRLHQVDPGFDTDNLITFRLLLPESRYAGGGIETRNFYDQLLTRLSDLPGTDSVTAASVLPLVGGDYTHRAFVVYGDPIPPAGSESIAAWHAVTPGYFTTLGIPVLRGRGFNEFDRRDGTPVVIINDTLARQMFPNENPIGQHIWRWRLQGDRREVIGVVQDVSFYDASDQNRPQVYVPMRQDPRRSVLMALRTHGDPLVTAAGLRQAVRSMDESLAVAGLETVERAAGRRLARPRFLAFLTSGFAATALVLAVLGVWGIVSHSISQRRREIGLRIALGAQAGDVLGLFLRQALVLGVVGVALGLFAAFALVRLLSNLLYGVTVTDLPTWVGACVLLIGAVLAAGYIPARRATKVDPMVALRYE
ncbi:MAG: ABC transporter permease [Phycisphaerales bacterium]|nr:MAG: ABC transporter permease [Phycisphaerales bacterium]